MVARCKGPSRRALPQGPLILWAHTRVRESRSLHGDGPDARWRLGVVIGRFAVITALKHAAMQHWQESPLPHEDPNGIGVRHYK